jgi:outer membrane protein TolC
MQALVAQVATAYFDLREYDAELEYVRESIAARQESVKLVAAREEGGVASMLELDQAKSLVASAQSQAALLEKVQEQTENVINFLIGKDGKIAATLSSSSDGLSPDEHVEKSLAIAQKLKVAQR